MDERRGIIAVLEEKGALICRKRIFTSSSTVQRDSMNVSELIHHTFPLLRPSDDLTQAKQWMDEYHVKQLPVVCEDEFLGFISDELLYDTRIMHATVGEYPLLAAHCFVLDAQHYFDALKTLYAYEMDMVAVLDAEKHFVGLVLASDILKEMGDTALVSADGAIIGLKCSLKNYSLGEISGIVERNDAHLFGVNVKTDKSDPSSVEIVLRVNQHDVGQITASLANSGYLVTSTYHTEDQKIDEKERFGLLMKYLNP